MCFILHGIEKAPDSTLPEAPSQFSIHRHANRTTRLWPWSRRKRRENPSRQRQTPPAPKRRLWPMGNGRYARAFGSTQCPIFLACVEQSVCRKKRSIFITKCIIAWFFLDVKRLPWKCANFASDGARCKPDANRARILQMALGPHPQLPQRPAC